VQAPAEGGTRIVCFFQNSAGEAAQ
jgi:hypothetical protein